MSEEKKPDPTVNAVLALVQIVGTPIWLAWSGLVLHRLWGWFVVPLGLPPIGIAHAAGLGLLCTFASYRNLKAEENMLRVLVAEIFVPGTFLCWGWLVHRYIAG